tara:strand:+ start:359 stop:1039 length:681 start_codon:yes stop_codon:yes gene_type:complete
MIITIITIIITLIIIVLASLYYWCSSPIIEEYKSNVPGPKIVILSGTHGNELAPHYAAVDYFNSHNIKKGSITLIIVNKCGILFNDREQGLINPYNDINRSYEKNRVLNKYIEKYIKDATLVIDLHESIKYDMEGGLGNTITYNKSYLDVESLINKINTTYKGPQWTSYNTTRNYNYGYLPGALIWFCKKKGISYMLIETCKKDSYIRRQKITHTILQYIYYKYLT